MSLLTQRPHTVRLTQRPGTPDEHVVENVPAHIVLNDGFFDAEPVIREGDMIESDMLGEPMRAVKVVRGDGHLGNIPPNQQVSMASMRSERAKAEIAHVTQHFHASVGTVAGRDVNITASIVLEAFAKQIESTSLPEEEKRSLVTRFRELAEHPVVAGLATNLIWQALGGGGA
jgi:hypothetical protein